MRIQNIWIKYGLILGISLGILWANQVFLYVGWNTISIYGVVLIVLGFVWGFAFTYRQKHLDQLNQPESVDQITEYQINPQELLSNREIEVLAALPTGKSNKELAAHFFVSENTIKTHLKQIYSKMDVRNRVEAIEKGKALKWIE
ncbi:MAG: helix-turn-helix transcriptional regulator [Bacteroidota bacterium]